MKRIITLASIVLVLSACDNSGSSPAENSAERVKDSLDSIQNLKIESIEEAAQEAKDTIREANDSLKQVVDSVAQLRK